MPANAHLGIVIVTRNRCESLLRTLRHLHALEASYPIVVVDNNSQDGTSEHVRYEFPEVQVIELNDNVGAVARNYGVRGITCPYVAFSDDDSWWAEGALARAVEYFSTSSRLGLIMSRVLVGANERLDPCCQLMAQSPLPRTVDMPGTPILGFLGCGAIVRCAAFLDVGGFHHRFGSGGEEALLALDLAQAGWGLAYVPDIISHHYPHTQRDVERRQAEGIRNLLWLTWLRRTPQHVVGQTLTTARKALSDHVARQGMLQAIRGIPWVLQERSPISMELEFQLDVLQRQREGDTVGC